MKSLNRRVLVGAGLVLIVFVAFTAAALDRAFSRAALAAQQQRMLGSVYLLIGAAEVEAGGRLVISEEPPVSDWARPGSGRTAYIVAPSGEPVWRSASSIGMTPPPFPRPDPGVNRFTRFRDSATGEIHLLQVFGVRWNTADGAYPFTFAVVSDRAELVAGIAAFRRTLWGWLTVMTLLLLAGQAGVLRWGLRPLRDVAGEITAIESGTRDRVTGTYPLELQRLTGNINTLLRHERTRQSRYRNALADLAHSLKTPLTVLRSTLDDPPAADETRRTLADEVDRMDRIVQYQLQRAATAGRSSMNVAVALRPLVERLTATLRKVHREKSVELQNEMEESLTVRADEGDLTELLGNLLDNGFKWCRGRIRLRGAFAGDAVEVRVEDDGPGFPEEKRDAVLTRGVRADQTVPGHGIGLAMVRDIVEAYDGELSIEKSPLGGAAVRIRFPV